MNITNGLIGVSLIVAVAAMGGCASSQPRLTEEEILA